MVHVSDDLFSLDIVGDITMVVESPGVETSALLLVVLPGNESVVDLLAVEVDLELLDEALHNIDQPLAVDRLLPHFGLHVVVVHIVCVSHFLPSLFLQLLLVQSQIQAVAEVVSLTQYFLHPYYYLLYLLILFVLVR